MENENIEMLESSLNEEETIESETIKEPIYIYSYSAKTKEYLGSQLAEKDPAESKLKGEFVALVPANATLLAPPEVQEGQAAIYTSHIEEENIVEEIPIYDEENNITGYETIEKMVKKFVENWEIKADYRKTHKLVDESLNITDIKEVGEIEGVKITNEKAAEIEANKSDFVFDNGEVRAKTDEEKAQEEAQRIAMLNLTAADVERGIYKALGLDFEDIIEQISLNPPARLDIKALKIELKANNFYRGNPYIDAVGGLLGLTKEQLDKFFETNDYTYLLPTTEENTEVENPSNSGELDQNVDVNKMVDNTDVVGSSQEEGV